MVSQLARAITYGDVVTALVDSLTRHEWDGRRACHLREP